MQSIPGYSGFRRERDKEPVCEKPGALRTRVRRAAQRRGYIAWARHPCVARVSARLVCGGSLAQQALVAF